LIPVLICLALAILTVITFWSLKDCGFINFDDNVHVYENANVQSGLNWNSIGYAFSFELRENIGHWHPVTWLSLMLDYSIFGLNPHGYHLMNLLFHVLNTILLFLIFHRMTKKLWPSAFVACLFAIHPLHVESVAWITERRDVLSTFFWMLTMGAYSYYVEHRGFRRYSLVLLFFVLGLMAKSMLITLPFVLLLLDYWPLQRFQEIKPDHKVQTEVSKLLTSDKQKKKSKKKNAIEVSGSLELKKPAEPEYKWSLIYSLLWEKVPFFVLAICSTIVTYIAAQSAGAVHSEEFPLVVRIGNAFISYVAYIGKMIWPINLAVFYPYLNVIPWWRILGSVFLLIAITLIVIWRAKRSPYLATGWLWYAGTLMPVIGIVQAGDQAMADRYTYIPLIGLFIMVAWGVPDLLKKWNHRKEILLTSSALSILCLCIITWTQVGYWQSSITLYDHTLKVTDNNWLAYNNRGNAYNALGNYKQAIEDFDRAIVIRQDYAEAYNNRGIAYLNQGDSISGCRDAQTACELKSCKLLELAKSKGDCRFSEKSITASDWFYKAVPLINTDPKKAIEYLDNAIKLQPNYASAYNNKGAAYLNLNQYQRAIEEFNKAISFKQDFSDAYNNRAVVYFNQGNNELGCRDAKKCCELGACATLEAAKVKGLCH
jgi:tetratricopeptide (TPR) repeat protein